MIMNDKVRDFIEQNIELIELNKFDKLIRKCPTDLRPGLFQALAEAGIEFPDIEDGTLYGLQTVPDIKQWFGKTFRDTHKLCISSLDKKTGEYRYSYVKANGVKGGYQIAFPSLKKAMNFANKVRQEENLAPYLISYPEGYNWDTVTLVNGEQVLATDKCIKDLDPELRRKREAPNKAYNKFEREVQKYLQNLTKNVDPEVIEKFAKNKQPSIRIYEPEFNYWLNNEARWSISFMEINDIKGLEHYLKSVIPVQDIKVNNSAVTINDPYIDKLKQEIYKSYGL